MGRVGLRVPHDPDASQAAMAHGACLQAVQKMLLELGPVYQARVIGAFADAGLPVSEAFWKASNSLPLPRAFPLPTWLSCMGGTHAITQLTRFPPSFPPGCFSGLHGGRCLQAGQG